MSYLAFAKLFAITAAPAPAPLVVELGVDCAEPFTVSLPDDVLTEREGK